MCTGLRFGLLFWLWPILNDEKEKIWRSKSASLLKRYYGDSDYGDSEEDDSDDGDSDDDDDYD